MGPGDTLRSDARRVRSRELLDARSGAVDLTVAGDVHRLRTGDSARLDADLPRTFANPSTARRARFAPAVHEPNVGREP